MRDSEIRPMIKAWNPGWARRMKSSCIIVATSQNTLQPRYPDAVRSIDSKVWTCEKLGEFDGKWPSVDYLCAGLQDTKLSSFRGAGQPTVIAATITKDTLSQKQFKHLAIMVQDGIAMSAITLSLVLLPHNDVSNV